MTKNELFRKSLLRSITILSTQQENADEEPDQPSVNQEWINAMMRLYLLTQNT